MTTSERDLADTETASPTDRQRHEIEETRADMGRTLERIEDRVSPTRIKERQTDRLTERWNRTKDRVMGSDPQQPGVADRMSDATDGAVNAVQEAPDRLEHATRGNPIAAGLIAAGLGALAGSLIPTSEPERALGGKLRDDFEEPVRSELQQAGEDMRDELRDDAQRSADAVKVAAQESFERTRDEAEDSARRVKEEAEAEAQAQSSAEGGTRTPAPQPSTPPPSTPPPGTVSPPPHR